MSAADKRRLTKVLGRNILNIPLGKNGSTNRNVIINQLLQNEQIVSGLNQAVQRLQEVCPLPERWNKAIDAGIDGFWYVLNNFRSQPRGAQGLVSSFVNNLFGSTPFKKSPALQAYDIKVREKFNLPRRMPFHESKPIQGGQSYTGQPTPSDTGTRHETQKTGSTLIPSNLSKEQGKGEMEPSAHPDTFMSSASIPEDVSLKDSMNDLSSAEPENAMAVETGMRPRGVIQDARQIQERPTRAVPGYRMPSTENTADGTLANSNQPVPSNKLDFNVRSRESNMIEAAISMDSSGPGDATPWGNQQISSTAYQQTQQGTGGKTTLGATPGVPAEKNAMLTVFPQSTSQQGIYGGGDPKKLRGYHRDGQLFINGVAVSKEQIKEPQPIGSFAFLHPDTDKIKSPGFTWSEVMELGSHALNVIAAAATGGASGVGNALGRAVAGNLTEEESGIKTHTFKKIGKWFGSVMRAYGDDNLAEVFEGNAPVPGEDVIKAGFSKIPESVRSSIEERAKGFATGLAQKGNSEYESNMTYVKGQVGEENVNRIEQGVGMAQNLFKTGGGEQPHVGEKRKMTLFGKGDKNKKRKAEGSEKTDAVWFLAQASVNEQLAKRYQASKSAILISSPLNPLHDKLIVWDNKTNKFTTVDRYNVLENGTEVWDNFLDVKISNYEDLALTRDLDSYYNLIHPVSQSQRDFDPDAGAAKKAQIERNKGRGVSKLAEENLQKIMDKIQVTKNDPNKLGIKTDSSVKSVPILKESDLNVKKLKTTTTDDTSTESDIERLSDPAAEQAARRQYEEDLRHNGVMQFNRAIEQGSRYLEDLAKKEGKNPKTVYDEDVDMESTGTSSSAASKDKEKESRLGVKNQPRIGGFGNKKYTPAELAEAVINAKREKRIEVQDKARQKATTTKINKMRIDWDKIRDKKTISNPVLIEETDAVKDIQDFEMASNDFGTEKISVDEWREDPDSFWQEDPWVGRRTHYVEALQQAYNEGTLDDRDIYALNNSIRKEHYLVLTELGKARQAHDSERVAVLQQRLSDLSREAKFASDFIKLRKDTEARKKAPPPEEQEHAEINRQGQDPEQGLGPENDEDDPDRYEDDAFRYYKRKEDSFPTGATGAGGAPPPGPPGGGGGGTQTDQEKKKGLSYAEHIAQQRADDIARREREEAAARKVPLPPTPDPSNPYPNSFPKPYMTPDQRAAQQNQAKFKIGGDVVGKWRESKYPVPPPPPNPDTSFRGGSDKAVNVKASTGDPDDVNMAAADSQPEPIPARTPVPVNMASGGPGGGTQVPQAGVGQGQGAQNNQQQQQPPQPGQPNNNGQINNGLPPGQKINDPARLQGPGDRQLTTLSYQSNHVNYRAGNNNGEGLEEGYIPYLRTQFTADNANIILQINENKETIKKDRQVWQLFKNNEYEANQEHDNPFYMMNIIDEVRRFRSPLDKEELLAGQAAAAIQESYDSQPIAYVIPEEVKQYGDALLLDTRGGAPLMPLDPDSTDAEFHDIYWGQQGPIPKDSAWNTFTQPEGTAIPDSALENGASIAGNDWPLLSMENNFISTTLA